MANHVQMGSSVSTICSIPTATFQASRCSSNVHSFKGSKNKSRSAPATSRQLHPNSQPPSFMMACKERQQFSASPPHIHGHDPPICSSAQPTQFILPLSTRQLDAYKSNCIQRGKNTERGSHQAIQGVLSHS
ncbi:hypothetical protein ACLOJK_023529 [Asimina triloba]